MGAAGSVVALNAAEMSDISQEIGLNSGSADAKWLAADDFTSLPAAKGEIKRLRGLAVKHLTQSTSSAVTESNVKNKARQAVIDNQTYDMSKYTKKTVAKEAEVQNMIRRVMKDNVLFSKLQEAECSDIVDAFESMKVKKGETVIKQGDKGDYFYIVEKGSVDIFVKQAGAKQPVKVGHLDSSKLDDGDAHPSFGELALMYGTPRAATVTCTTDCALWVIDRTTYRMILNYQTQVRAELYSKFLGGVTMSDGEKGPKKTLKELLTTFELAQLAGAMETESFSPGEVIIREGQKGDLFYVIVEGEVAVYKNKKDGKKAAAKSSEGMKKRGSVISPDTKITALTQGAFFGEKALLSEDVRQASCVATTSVTCLSLERDEFNELLGPLQDLLSGKAPAAEEAVPGAALSAASEEHETFAGLDDLDVMQTLGRGAFGRVKLCVGKKSGKSYALKCQGKKAIVENSLQEHILMERKIMLQLDHPFILKLCGAFKDDRYIYFVLEVLLGGELFSHLRRLGRFEERDAKFFASSVVLAFQHMHAKKVAYRDLKPENLVLDDTGYVKVVDFGLAKVVNGKTWTLCGTPDYLAPEIILNEGHDKAVDCWALGVLIYEMIAGIPPFYADDPMEVYEKILSSALTFPPHFPKPLNDICKKLLKLSQSKRLGNGKGQIGAIIKHKWFSGFDWEGLCERSLEVPVPIEVKNNLDTDNFDKYAEEDQPMEECKEWDPDLTN